MIDAIVPAAGRSLRMGDDHKLLLPWGDRLVIEHVLSAWLESIVDHVVVIVRADDQHLQRVCERWDVEVVVPREDPADMKRSIQLGLDRIRSIRNPTDRDRWMIAPADLPTMHCQLINRVAQETVGADDDQGQTQIVVPRFDGHAGHPVSFSWSLADEVFGLPADQGVNALVTRYGCRWLDLPTHWRPRDIDTPEDYRRLTEIEPPPSGKHGGDEELA